MVETFSKLQQALAKGVTPVKSFGGDNKHWFSGKRMIERLGEQAAELMFWRYLLYAPDGSLSDGVCESHKQIILSDFGGFIKRDPFWVQDYNFLLKNGNLLPLDYPYFILGPDTSFPFSGGPTNRIDVPLVGDPFEMEYETALAFLQDRLRQHPNFWRRLPRRYTWSTENAIKSVPDLWVSLFSEQLETSLTALEHEIVITHDAVMQKHFGAVPRVRFEIPGDSGDKETFEYVSYNNPKLSLPARLPSIEIFLGRACYSFEPKYAEA